MPDLLQAVKNLLWDTVTLTSAVIACGWPLWLGRGVHNGLCLLCWAAALAVVRR